MTSRVFWGSLFVILWNISFLCIFVAFFMTVHFMDPAIDIVLNPSLNPVLGPTEIRCSMWLAVGNI